MMVRLAPFLNFSLLLEDCNPNYLGRRDQKDLRSKPAQANSSQDPIKKKTSQGVRPEFKPQCRQKKKYILNI
jgi:hypothetical protein